ncbi:hypothetical protein SLEP1_g54254 [Rubroshorea leprosula]|uniref:Disease resistance RPP13-like protein 1 n=1 Tax=Rubroshorea leprosula TaxID=152421 RepID=A0AAV5MBU5_9ROSI|nr:hypothetical protein SLEP1_g54254 [Rubroshorea leprosula]
MEFLSFAGGFLLPGIFDWLREKLNEYISDQLIGYISDQLQNSEEEVRAQMESWKTLLSKITAILQHAEENQGANMFVKSYLDDLKDLAYDMEDILEEFVIDARSCKKTTESSLLEDMVLGRDSYKQAILQRLLEDGGSLEQDFVIPIVGMGGIGKTTLARLIYNDEKLEGKFDLKSWVSVAHVFDVPKITRTILEQVTSGKCDLDDFDSLQTKLKEELSRRKFFLVLDDVWNKEYGNWDKLKRPFMSGAPGSKIIVTTRNKDFGMMMRGDVGVYNLQLLQDDACLPLFTWHALGKENLDVHLDLQDVGEKLVESDIWSLSEDRSGILPALRLSYNDLPCHLKRCFAYCALFPKDYEFDKKELVLLWMAEGLLQQQSRGKKQMEEEIGHQYFQELLSRSLFQQSSTNKSHFVMHDLINDLAIDVAGEIYCNLERSMDAWEANLDKIHGLEELVLEWTALDDEDESVLEMQVLINWLKPHSNLKSLEISSYGGQSFPNWICDPSLFLNLSSMELRYCSRCTSLPSLGLLPVLKKLIIEGMEAIEAVGPEFYGRHDSFRSLEELTFQNMSNWKEWTSLTGSEGEFPCLRRLVICCCAKLLGLPNNLSSLKELEVLLCEAMTCWPTSLLSLKELSIDYCNGELLKSMVDLTSLTNLVIQNIEGPTCLPMSVSLPSLKELYIGHCNGVLFKSMVDLTSLTDLSIENIVEPTCLPMNVSLPSLKELYIGHCNGVLFKSLVDLTSLTSLSIQDIVELTCLPESFTQSLTALETLNIQRSDAMTMKVDGSSSSNTSMFMSRLEKLEIRGCDSLKSFPGGKLPITLKFLNIADCKGLEFLPDADGDNNNSNLHLEIRNVPCLYSSEGCHQLPAFLKKFTVDNGSEWLESFPERMLQQYCPGIEFILDGGLPPNLTELQLWGCKNLKRVPNTMYQLTLLQRLSISGRALTIGLQNLLSLQNLTIAQKFPLDIVLPSSLTSLKIWNEENLESIPGGLFQNLSSLSYLSVRDCPKLRSLPREAFPPSLGYLYIGMCPHLKRQRFEAKGDYWTLTHNIPYVEINQNEVIKASVN